MKNVPNIEYISSSNKLRISRKEETTYSERKQLSIEVTTKQLNDKPELTRGLIFKS